MLKSLERMFKLWKNQKKHYQSPTQIALDQWDKEHPLSASQKQEARIHQQIHYKRDHASQTPDSASNWLDQDDIP